MDAIAAARRILHCVAIGEKHLPEQGSIVAASAGSLGSIYEAKNKYPEAESFYVKMVDLYNKNLDKNSPELATASNDLARIYIAEKKYNCTAEHGTGLPQNQCRLVTMKQQKCFISVMKFY